MIIIFYIVTHKSYELMKIVGDCSTKCGNGIQINKTTTCTISLSDPLDCTTKSENGTCKLEECPQEYTFGTWSGWGPCDKTCQKGLQDRSYKIRTRTCTPSNCSNSLTTEKRECRDIDICPQDCPDIKRTQIRPQSNQSIEFEAVFSMAKVEFIPYGQLDRQELHLEITKSTAHVLPSTPNVIIITNDDFDTQEGIVEKVIHNLHQVVAYKPIIKVFVTVNFGHNENSNSKISSVVHICEEEVSYHLFLHRVIIILCNCSPQDQAYCQKS